MKRLFAPLLALVSLASCSRYPSATAATPTPTIASEQAHAWPSLPTSGFISGRLATTEDVAAGNAAFAMQTDGDAAPRPSRIVVPQYAFYRQADGRRVPGIVIQAEELKGVNILGFRPFGSDKLRASPDSSFELLGTSPPSGPLPAHIQ